jgi:ArsR family transcriptional regulator, arsenate/arsenite/antimonite-responsive transcriptional repressor
MQLIKIRMNTYTDFFKALSDETRLRMLNLLITSEDELCVCEFTDILEIPTYNISKHLKILKNTGLVNERKEGRWVYFGLPTVKEKFLSLLFETIKEIPEPQLKADLVELQKRFDIRVKGKCLLGIQKEHLKSKKHISI